MKNLKNLRKKFCEFPHCAAQVKWIINVKQIHIKAVQKNEASTKESILAKKFILLDNSWISLFANKHVAIGW